ncbi:alcohol dehydrogenase [Saccharopolyspora subtropica]|uniref:Alcohol dehydrogenase n=1 Tax=Saccharopolyspora thermophila TaxID=89367 RepID=A0A917NFS6_9PSEU|nr:alcohol dehydrogenase [Saccharopolyspora subtropica]
MRVRAPGRVELVETELGAVPPDQVRVRVRETGLCGSDVKMWSGGHAVLKPPMVLGHETWGVVEAVGTAVAADHQRTLEPGTPVVVVPPRGCGSCYNCARDREQLCEHMRFVGAQIDGGMARFITVEPEHLLPIPPEVPPELRVLIEPLAVSVHAVHRAAARTDDQVVVLGAGPIGVFCALVLLAEHVETVVIVDRSEQRLQLATLLGIPNCISSAGRSVREAVAGTIRPEGADVVLDCVGSQPTTTEALATTCRGGRTVLVGISPQELHVDGVALQRGERELVGVQMYQRRDFHQAMSLLASGLLRPVDGLKRRWPLAHAGRLLEQLAREPSPFLKETVQPD